MSRRVHNARQDSGFTLIEILVALAILGLVVSMISGAIGNAARLNVAGEVRLAEAARINAIKALLKRQIEGVLPLDLPDGAGGTAPVFAGRETAATFATRRPTPLLPGGVYLTRLIYRRSAQIPDGGELIASWQRLVPSAPQSAQNAPVETQLLLGQVADARFFYYGQKPDGEPGWHASWQGLEAMPSLIRIELEPAADADWRWSPLVLAPRISVPVVLGLHPIRVLASI